MSYLDEHPEEVKNAAYYRRQLKKVEEQLAAVTAERDKLKAEREQMEKQEPVMCGWTHPASGQWNLTVSKPQGEYAHNITPFYAHQPVPDGKVLVPIEPTEAIAEAFDECWRSECVFAETYWEAMLKAAQGE